MTVPRPDDQVADALETMIAGAADVHPTAEEMVISVIRNAIANGIFAPGERLAQDRLAQLFRVSRMPIRSALRQLESEGLVEFHPHRGATVRALTTEEISDLYEMRILIETFALSKTVAAITDQELDDLTQLAAAHEARDQTLAWTESRDSFYRALYAIGNTPRVVATILQFQAEVRRYTTDLSDHRAHVHNDLLERVRLGDPELAAAWLEAHLREVARDLQNRILEQQRETP